MVCGGRKKEGHYPQPLWTLGTEAEALKTEANASGAAAVGVHLLVAFLGGKVRMGVGGWRREWTLRRILQV